MREIFIQCNCFCLENPGYCSYDIIFRCNKPHEMISRAFSYLTAEKMELTCVIEALNTLIERSHIHLKINKNYIKNNYNIIFSKLKDEKSKIENRELWVLLERVWSKHVIDFDF